MGQQTYNRAVFIKTSLEETNPKEDVDLVDEESTEILILKVVIFASTYFPRIYFHDFD